MTVTERRGSLMFIYSKRFYYASYGSLHMVRTAYDETHDFVNAFFAPLIHANRNLNFFRCALIDRNTPYDYLYTALIEAEEYKECGDDIAPLRINGYFIGANHGNPNLTDVFTEPHGLDERAIGEDDTDGVHLWTIVQVQDDTRLLLAYINGDEQAEVVEVGNELRFVQPSGKALCSETIPVMGSCKHMNFRPCGNESSVIVYGDGKPAENNRFYDDITVLDSYNILDMADVVKYLKKNAGHNTNESYFSREIPGVLAKMSLKHVFDEKGRISTCHEVEICKKAHLDSWFGAQQINFSHDESSWFNAPDSEYGKGWHPAKLGTEIRKTGDIVPYTYYLLDPGRKKGYYLFIDTETGCGKNEYRKEWPKSAKISEWRTKLYCFADVSDRDVDPGFRLSISYSKGPFDPKKNIEENGYFTLNGKKHPATGRLNA